MQHRLSRFTALICVLQLFWLLPASLSAQGDTPCNATPLSVSPGTCAFTPGTTVGSTYQSNTANGGMPACGFAGAADVWYSFVVPPSGSVAITMEAGSISDPALSIYSGPCSAPVPMDCDDDSGLDMMPVIDRSDFTPGSTIFIRIWNNNAVTGTFGVCVTESHSDCGTASVLCSNLQVSSNAYGGGSVQDGDWSGNNCIPDEYQSQWFKFQVLNTGMLAFTISPAAITSGFYPDYDWTLWRVNTTPFCESFLPNMPAFSCNASSSMGPQGQTGVGPSGTSSSEPTGPGNPYCAAIPVTAGDVFYLWVNNFTNSSSGFDFLFDPSVALNCDFDDVNPTVSSSSTPTCPGICSGSATVTATNMTAPLSYSWSSNAAGQNTAIIHNLCAGTYIVTVTGADGEVILDTVAVSENPAIALQITHTDNTSCANPNGTVQISASGGSGSFQFSWNASTVSNDSLFQLSAGTYTVTVNDGNNCSATAAAQVLNVVTYPVIHSISTTDSVACGALCVTLSAFVTGAAYYHWEFGDGESISFSHPYHCYTAPGQYTVQLIASTAGGCTDTLTRTHFIRVNPFPHAQFTVSKSDQLDASFRDLSHGVIQNWFWEFGDSTHAQSTQQDPEFTYPDFGEYCVQLTVWDTNNCSDQTLQCMTFNPPLMVYAPNAFTPNDDGLNDVFRIQGFPVRVLKFWIFNRWGEEIYYTNSPEAGWDGRRLADGTISPQDTYIYKTEVIGEQGEKREMTGYFQLIH